MKDLTVTDIKREARNFLLALSQRGIKSLFGVTDGKAVGTYVEQEFHAHLERDYDYVIGSSARGIDFPELGLDLKVTSARQPQSSCPYRAAEQKVYGLGYHLMVFVYDKRDDAESELAYLNFVNAVFVEDKRTADFQTTSGIINLLNNGANLDDIDAFLEERNLPLDDIGRRMLAERIAVDPPKQGYVTVSNALQWRLQYARTLSIAGQVDGVDNLL
ncbi:MAG: restriction endonuclease [Chloroflexota bacterium]|nr:restriction endonuclease [Chloroflexota bacterium]MDE2950500.1 restriction endonuclease [Chloroflexota bacterium]